MNLLLLERSLGSGPRNALFQHFNRSQIHSLTLSKAKFASGTQSGSENTTESISVPIAHHGGVNALAIDALRGKHLLAGAASGSISLYNLNEPSDTLKPINELARGAAD